MRFLNLDITKVVHPAGQLRAGNCLLAPVPDLQLAGSMRATAQLRVGMLPKSWRPASYRGVKRVPVRAATRPGPIDSARAAGLRYTTDAVPGITRRRSGSGFTYVTESGHSSFRQPGKTSGSVPIREVIFRQRAATRADGSSIDIIPAGAKFATR